MRLIPRVGNKSVCQYQTKMPDASRAVHIVELTLHRPSPPCGGLFSHTWLRLSARPSGKQAANCRPMRGVCDWRYSGRDGIPNHNLHAPSFCLLDRRRLVRISQLKKGIPRRERRAAIFTTETSSTRCAHISWADGRAPYTSTFAVRLLCMAH